jgi:hypothetical protein
MKGKYLVIAVLLGATGLAWLGAQEKKPRGAKAAALPAELARIPRDAGVVLSLRPADLWASEAGKAFRKRLGKDVRKVSGHFEEALGVTPEQVERLSLAFLGELQGELMVVRTRKPYDRKAVVQVCAPDAEEEKYKGHALYVTPRERALLVIDKTVFAVGRLDLVKRLFDNPDGEEGLTPALRAAADKKNVVVLGVNPPAILYQLTGRIPRDLEPFKPLLRARSAMMTVQVGETVRADVRVSFVREAHARAGKKAGDAGLKFVVGVLGDIGKQVAREKGAKELRKVLALVARKLQDEPLKLRGTELTASLEVGAGAALDSLALHVVQHLRMAAARAAATNNLKQLGLAMHSYADKNEGRLPPQAVLGKDGKALLSWRVLILPYLEQDALYKEFHLDEAWDSPHNKKLLKKMPKVYAHPASPARRGETHFQAFVGNGAFFEGKRGLRFPADFPDGTSNTIMFVEAAKAVPWTKPEDLPYNPKKPLPKLGGFFPGGFLAGLCDGSVRFVRNSVSTKTLRNAITRNDGEVLGADW